MKCTKCGGESISSKICPTCMKSWTDMREAVFLKLQEKYGRMTPSNHETFKHHIKRMEKFWRKDKDQFKIQLEKL
jgi:Zn-finger nucleic acid-binding protein